jgi:hypothetical protein
MKSQLLFVRTSLLILAIAGMLTAAPARAAKRTVKGLTLNVSVALDVEGTPLAVDATATIQKFSLSGGQLFASGAVTGTATLNGVTKPISATFNTRASVAATCTATTGDLTVTLESLTLNVNNIPLALSDLSLTASGTRGTLVGDLICSIADVLSSGDSTTALITLLNKLLSAGAVPSSVSLAGTLDITTLSLQNGQLVASGTLVGTLMLGGISLAVNSTFDVQALVSATCTATDAALSVVLQQLDLSLNGLSLSVGQTTVAVNVDASSALYPLICDISSILDTTVLDVPTLIALLEQVFALL